MSRTREFWIYKGTSQHGDALVLGDDCETMDKMKPDGFYDLISPNDTIEGGTHVVEYSVLEQFQVENAKLKEQIQKADELLRFITTNNWILLRKDLENLLGMISEARQALKEIGVANE